MIAVQILTKNKVGGNSNRSTSSFKQVSSNNTGGSANFTARVLWGQRFDGNSDVYGDMKIRGRIDECTGLAVSGAAGIGGSLTVDGSIYRAGYTVFDQGNSGVGHGWVQLYPNKEYFLSTNQFGEVTDYVRFLDRIRVEKGISTSVIDASQGNFTNIRATEITTDYLTVTKKAHFFSLVIDEVKAVGGQLIVTPARAKIDLVEPRAGGGWRCYFRAEDPDGNKIHNEFDSGDQIICQTFNAAVGISYNVSNTYWWRLCTGVSSTPVPRNIDGKVYDCHWFDLSENDCDYRSDAPAVGDECVLLGNRTDTDRQDAIIISAYRNTYLDPEIESPSFCQYSGINSYDIESHRMTWFSKSGNTIRGNLIVENGLSVEDYIKDIIGDTSIDPDNPNSGNYIHLAWSNSSTDWTKDASRSDEDWTYLGTCANDDPSDAALTYYSYRWTRIKGSSVTNIKEYYMRTEAGVNTPSWSDSRWVLNDPPQLTETYRWLWNYEEFIFTNTTIKTEPRVIGVFGSGKGIQSVENWYLTTAAGSGVTVDDPGWSQTAEPPSITKPYLWNYEIIYWTDNTSQVIDPHIISVFSDIEDISIGFENSYRMLDAGSYAIVQPNDELIIQIAFDLLCISGTTTTRLRPMDSAFPSNISATFQTYSGAQTAQPSGTVQQPASSSYTWVYGGTQAHFLQDYKYASHVTVRLNIGGNQVDSFSVPVILEPGSYFDTIGGLTSRVQDMDASLKTLDSSYGWVSNKYSEIEQTVGSIGLTVSEISTGLKNALSDIADISGGIASFMMDSSSIISTVEAFQQKFGENGELLDDLDKISSIVQRCDTIESSVLEVSAGQIQNQSRITQLSDRITSEVSDASHRMSEIEQSVSNISLSVQSGVTSDQLKRTGIDITEGKIRITASNTEWAGDIYIRPESAGESPKGLILSDINGENAIQIKNNNLGSLNSYSFDGGDNKALVNSGNHSSNASTVTGSFRTALNGGEKYLSGTNVEIYGLLFDITDDSHEIVISIGPDRTISSITLTYKIVNGSGTVRKSESSTITTSEHITRTAWYGYRFEEISYTTTTDETLYLEASYTCNMTGAGKTQSYRYTATLDYQSNKYYESINRIGLDAIAFGKKNEYIWAGDVKGPNRSYADYGIVLRNRMEGIMISPVGLFRTTGCRSDSDANDWSKWGDISSIMPVIVCNEASYTADLYKGIIIMKYDGSKTVYLPNPSTCPGKWYFIKNACECYGTTRNRGWGDLYIRCTAGNKIVDSDDGNVRDQHEIGGTSCLYISDGSFWYNLWGE